MQIKLSRIHNAEIETMRRRHEHERRDLEDAHKFIKEDNFAFRGTLTVLTMCGAWITEIGDETYRVICARKK